MAPEREVVFITGSTRGIGWASAREFARTGATVLLHGHSDPARLSQRVQELKDEFGVEADGFLYDVADSSASRDCYQDIFKRYGGLSVLVNNAGILRDYLIGMIPEDGASELFAVNTTAPIFHLQAAARLMMRRKRGAIVNVSSIVGVNGNAGQVVYAASKAAVIGMTKAAAKELAPHNIRVNAVAPGFIQTDMVSEISPEKYKQRVDSIKMKRVGTPEDVARVIAFLASEAAIYVTGQIVGVDGGMLI